MRVERRVTVSEQSIEDYFNGLADTSCPEGLVPKAPFEETTLCFKLPSENTAVLDSRTPTDDEASKDKLLTGEYCDRALVESLWHAKKRLDDLWNLPPPPMARSLMNRVARGELFPHSDVGGSKDSGDNRASDKLAELAEAVGLLDGIPENSAFLDLCGGPGSWSQFLLARRDLALRGFGYTLRAAAGDSEDWNAQKKDEWYPELSSRSDWTALWGKDGTGDLLKVGNMDHACTRLEKERVLLCVADGGFNDSSIPPNLLELYFYRLFLGELLMAVRVLQPGGRFVCKLYGTCSQHTNALLYCATRLFLDVSIVKPRSSRATGPERYLVAFGRKTGKEAAEIVEALSRAHDAGCSRSPLVAPLLTPVVAADVLAADKPFIASVYAMTQRLCDRNAKAINAVVDRAEYLESMALAVNEELANPRSRKSKVSKSKRETRASEAVDIGVSHGDSVQASATEDSCSKMMEQSAHCGKGLHCAEKPVRMGAVVGSFGGA
jgi:hypothetical protein